MKKYIIATLATLFVTPLALAAEVICPADWQASYSCNQCFQFYVTEDDFAFSSSDIFFARGNLEAGNMENLWLDDSTITGFAMQGANIGPVGNLKNIYEFPHDDGIHANGKRYSSFGPGESKTWARMPSGKGIGIENIPDTINPEVPVYRIEYVTTSEVELPDGQIKPDSRRVVKECAMYSYVPLESGGAALEITKDDNDNHDDYQEIKTGGSGIASGEAQIGGDAQFLIQVRNTGNTTLNDVYVRDPQAPDCDKDIGRLAPGETFDYVCRDTNVTASYTNTARVEGMSASGQIVGDEDESYVTVSSQKACSITLNAPSGNVPLTSNIVCQGGSTNMRIVIGQNGNTITTYDGVSASHTFSQVGNYDVVCIVDGNPDLGCSTTVFATKSCGNGLVEAGEMCDDGNTASGDGCNVACQAESCGNGMIDPGEQCDDGNNNAGDQCTNICQRNTPNTGPEDIVFTLFFLSMLSASGWMVYRRRQIG